ncbi:hypothetical protein [Polaribacter sp. SA4-12]|uniref:hypothetical protein n=1 Tax=Polaribacter sp. SA4-12 TaxID=1312072 RepID=UPI001E53E6E0|nr:hypothetical protein [Polaribacter sp. SA4-12]
MYTYRLDSIPIYVIFGHPIIYARVFVFSKSSIIKKHHKLIENILYSFVSLFSLAYLWFFNDVFGFVMTIGVFALLIKKKKERVFFLTMYIVVAILEIIGTKFGCWKWPDVAFGIFNFLPSNNPPSGISLFYFILSFGAHNIYILRHKELGARFKNIRRIHI